MFERRTLRLVGLALALLAAYVGIEVLGAEPRARAHRRAESLFAALPDEVTEIRLGSGVTLVRAGSGFTLTAPVEAKADFEASQALLVRLLDAHRERRLSIPPDSLAPFGLDPPQAWGSVRTRRGKTVTVELGAPTPSANSLYGRIRETGDTFVVWGSLIRDLRKSADALRDRRLIAARVRDITALLIERPRGRLALSRDPIGGWRLTEPFSGRASAERVAGLLEGILGSRARVFLDSVLVTPRDPGAAAERRVARLVREAAGAAQEPESLVISVGEVAAPGGVLPVLATAQPRPVLCDPELLSLLDASADSLREDRVLPSGSESVTRFRLGAGLDTLALERAEAGWRIVRPETLDADPIRVRAFLRNLDNLRINGWGAGGAGEETGLGSPRAVLEAGLSGGRPDAGLLIGASHGEGERWAAFPGEEEPFLVPEAALAILAPDPGAFEARAVLAAAIAGAKRIRIEAAPGRGVTLERRRGAWRDASGTWDDALAGEAVARLARIEPLDRLALPDESAGFAASEGGPRITWDGPRGGSLLLGGDLDPERRFGRISGRRGTYLFYAPEIDSVLGPAGGRSR